MIKLNKLSKAVYKSYLRRKEVMQHSSPRGVSLRISAIWRNLFNATSKPSKNLPGWTEQEDEAAEIIVSTLVYLDHIECKNIEKLLRDKIARKIVL